MLAVIIHADPRALTPGDFRALMTQSTLHLSEVIAQLLADQGVRTAADPVAYLYAFPSFIAQALSWDAAEVKRGRETLCLQLRGVVDDDILHPPQQPPLSYGALDSDAPPPFRKSRW